MKIPNHQSSFLKNPEMEENWNPFGPKFQTTKSSLKKIQNYKKKWLVYVLFDLSSEQMQETNLKKCFYSNQKSQLKAIKRSH